MTVSALTNSVNTVNSLFSILGGQTQSQPALLLQSSFTDNENPLFSTISSLQQTSNKEMATAAMSAGADASLVGNYKAAVKDFTLSISYDSSQSNAVKAYNLIATVDTQNNDSDGAMKAYKSSIKVSPQTDVTYISLGNIYFSQKDYANAEKEYLTAVKLNPTSSTNLFSLGQAYLAEGRDQDAEGLFNKVISMNPDDKSGYYALGQTYSKEGRPNDAINEFQKVIQLDPGFTAVHVDLGSVYADLGQTDKANNELTYLQANDPTNATILSNYIDSVTKPKINAAYSEGSGWFDSNLGPGTEVYALNSSLAAPSATQLFTMEFTFSKNMDPKSVQNPYNWSISRSQFGDPGGAYNWGLPTQPTDVQISPIPLSVAYDATTSTAQVSFLVQQNADVTGTIDPSHIMFKFNGKDVYGNAMDTSADQYSGISQIA